MKWPQKLYFKLKELLLIHFEKLPLNPFFLEKKKKKKLSNICILFIVKN